MADRMHEPPGLPGAEIAEQYNTAIKQAITDGIDAGTRVAADASRRRSAWWSSATLVLAILAAAVTVWLLTHTRSGSASEWVVHHADGLNERCVLLPTQTPGGDVEFVCRLVPAPAAPVPSGARLPAPQSEHP